MTERPILFKGRLVRAILAGDKIQTRRVPADRYIKWKVGDHLWVRENFWIEHDSDIINDRLTDCGIDLKEDIGLGVAYPATDPDPEGHWRFFSKRPSIHMPRWVSRITLEITAIRSEHLRDITLADIKAEGVRPPKMERWIELWDSINAVRGKGWQVNPLVKVITFRRVNDI